MNNATNTEKSYCKNCGTTLGIDCGDAEPDFNESYCSKGCRLSYTKALADRMKSDEKRQISRCWDDVEHAVNSAHAKLKSCSMDLRCGTFFESGFLHITLVLNDHARQMENKNARSAIQETLDAITLHVSTVEEHAARSLESYSSLKAYQGCRWSQEFLFEVQTTFRKHMASLYEAAEHKKGYRVERWGFQIEHIEDPFYAERG